MARDGWVTVAAYLRAEEAEMLRGLLESANVPALVDDAALTGVNPLLAPAIGGAKVLVPEGDAEAAAAIVRESGVFPGGGEPAEEIPEAEWSSGAPREPAPTPLPLGPEALARRALSLAGLALLLSPTLIVPLFALGVAIRSWRSAGAVSARARSRAWAALALDIAALAVAAFFWVAVVPRLGPAPDGPGRWPVPVERTGRPPFP